MQERQLSHYHKVILEIIEPTVLIQIPQGRIIFTNQAFNRFFGQDRITTTGKILDNLLGTSIVSRLDLQQSGNFTIHYTPPGNSTEEHHLIVSCVWIEKEKYCLITFFDFGKPQPANHGQAVKLRPVLRTHHSQNDDDFDQENFDRAEDILKVQYEILDALQNVNNTEESLQEILNAICRIQGIRNCAVYLLNDLEQFRLLSYCLGEEPDKQYPPMIRKDYFSAEFLSTNFKQRYYQMDQDGIPANHLIPMHTDKRLLGILSFQINTLEVGYLAMDTLLVFANWISSLLDRDTSRRQLHETMQYYRALMENMNEGVAIVDRDERFTLVNRTLCEITGYSEEDFLGSKIWDFFEPIQSRKVKRMRDERSQQGDRKYEIMVQKKNGERIWVTISPTTLYDTSGNPTGVMAIITDITHYIEIVESFSPEYDGIMDVLKNVTNLSIFSFNMKKNKLEFANNHSINHYGFTYKELYALSHENLIDIVHSEDRSLVRNFFFDAEASAQKLVSTTLAYRIKTKFNDYRWVSSSFIAQKNDDGSIERVFCSSIDINDNRICSERLDEQYAFNRILFKNNPLPMLIVQDPITGKKLKIIENDKSLDPEERIEANLAKVQNRLHKMHIMETNDACLQLFELQHPQDMITSFHHYVTIEMIDGIRRSLIAFMKKSPQRWFPATAVTKNGRLLHLEVLINPVEFHENSLIIAFKNS